MSKVEFRYKDENKEEHVKGYDTKTCTEALNLWEQYLKENDIEGTKIDHMSVMDKNWRNS